MSRNNSLVACIAEYDVCGAAREGVSWKQAVQSHFSHSS